MTHLILPSFDCSYAQSRGHLSSRASRVPLLNHLVSSTMRGFFVGGNWKMNGSLRLVEQFATSDAAVATRAARATAGCVDVVICPPFPFLAAAKAAFGSDAEGMAVGAQNCHFAEAGAFTGEVSVGMLQELAVDWVIIGHSERRAVFGESGEWIGRKTQRVLDAGLRVILCVGETGEERTRGETMRIIETQLRECAASWPQWQPDRLVIAYEPVWAIGTGQVATPQQAQEVHLHLRQFVKEHVSETVAQQLRIIYGGSVTAENCANLSRQPDIDGFLVGGASLKSDDLACIIRSFDNKLQ